MSTDFASVPELTARTGLHPKTIYGAINRGEIPSVRIGGRVLIPRRWLDQQLHAGDEESPPDDEPSKSTARDEVERARELTAKDGRKEDR